MSNVINTDAGGSCQRNDSFKRTMSVVCILVR